MRYPSVDSMAEAPVILIWPVSDRTPAIGTSTITRKEDGHQSWTTADVDRTCTSGGTAGPPIAFGSTMKLLNTFKNGANRLHVYLKGQSFEALEPISTAPYSLNLKSTQVTNNKNKGAAIDLFDFFTKQLLCCAQAQIVLRSVLYKSEADITVTKH